MLAHLPKEDVGVAFLWWIVIHLKDTRTCLAIESSQLKGQFPKAADQKHILYDLTCLVSLKGACYMSLTTSKSPLDETETALAHRAGTS